MQSLKRSLLEHKSKLSTSEDSIARLESERAALRERLAVVESQSQENADEYRQELESRVMEMTNQVGAVTWHNIPLSRSLYTIHVLALHSVVFFGGRIQSLSLSLSLSPLQLEQLLQLNQQLQEEVVVLRGTRDSSQNSHQQRLHEAEQQLREVSLELASKREEECETRDKLHTCQQELEGLREELLEQVSHW